MNKRLLIFCQFILPTLIIAQWSAPINISPNAISAITNESMGSCIGVSGDTVHVVYVDRKSPTRGVVYYTRSSNTGLDWSPPMPITKSTGNAFNPAIAVNGSNIHVVWRIIDTLNQRRSSYYKHSIDGGKTWAAEITLDTSIADWPAVAVSGNHVYVANDIVSSSSPYNTEIFFLTSANNGLTWSSHKQITFSTGRSEDEALIANGADVFMSWNDNRNGKLQIFYKHSGDFGTNWDADVAIAPPNGYGTMVGVDGLNIDIPFAGAPLGRYQINLVQSFDSGISWETPINLTNDTAHTYYYPDMVRDGQDLHLTYIKSGTGGQYAHSFDGGKTWDKPYDMGTSGITPFIAYSGCMLHVIYPDSGHIDYLRNPNGNKGTHCMPVHAKSTSIDEKLNVQLYPNPFSEKVCIEINSNKEIESLVFKIFDLIGQEIISCSFDQNHKILLDKNKLNNGIYIYKIIQKLKLVATGKLVVK